MVNPLAGPIPTKIGIIAGQGKFPVLLAQAARSEGVEVVTFGVKSLVLEDIAKFSNEFFQIKLTEFTKFIQIARENGIRHLVMAGRVPHNVLHKQIAFDPRILKILGGLANKKANTLLNAVIEELKKEGFEVLDSTLFLKSLMPEPGLITKKVPPTDDILKDIEFGFPLAKEMGRLDIGQSIAVKNQIVVAVEAIEGTDRMIRRAGKLTPGSVIVKTAKPSQDMRFDVPVVGLTTINNLIRAEASAICISARQTLFFDRQEATALAEKHGICMISYLDHELFPT